MKTSNYKYQQKIIRIRWVDYVRIRHAFKPMKAESMSSYFQRLALYLRDLQD